jgi:hypothetical protein
MMLTNMGLNFVRRERERLQMKIKIGESFLTTPVTPFNEFGAAEAVFLKLHSGKTIALEAKMLEK